VVLFCVQLVAPLSRHVALSQVCERRKLASGEYSCSYIECIVSVGRLKANSYIACSAHAVPMPFPCHVVPLMVWIVSFHLIYTVLPYLIVFHTCHAMPMPCCDQAVLPKATSKHGRRETACGLPARVRLLPATTRSSTKIVIRSIQILLTTIHT